MFLFRLNTQKSATKQQPGANTWPITLVSYVYIRKDLSFIKNPARRTLLNAFATSLFDPDYIGLCERYGLVPVPTELRELSLVGLDMLELDASALRAALTEIAVTARAREERHWERARAAQVAAERVA